VSGRDRRISKSPVETISKAARLESLVKEPSSVLSCAHRRDKFPLAPWPTAADVDPRGANKKGTAEEAVPLRIKPGIKRELVELFSSWSGGPSDVCPWLLSVGLPWRR